MNKYKTPVTIITGATGSIGSSISYKLANNGEAVLLACRNNQKAESLRDKIISDTGNISIFCAPLSLDDFRSIKRFANNINENFYVKSIIHNAGIMNGSHKVTCDGFEHTLSVNYLGPILLTRMIIGNLQDNGNIIFTTSLTRKFYKLPPDYLFETTERFSQFKTYGKSKLALVHYALNLAKELKDRGINVNCIDPGIVDSNMITMEKWFDPLANIFFRPFIRNSSQGAEPAISALKSRLTGMVYTLNNVSSIPNRWLSYNNHRNLIINTDKIINGLINVT